MADRITTASPRGTAGKANAGGSLSGHGSGPAGVRRSAALIALGGLLAAAGVTAALLLAPAPAAVTPPSLVPPAAPAGALPPVPEARL